MTPEYILRKSLCRSAHCSNADIKTRAQQIEYMTFAPAYAEPGYSQPAKGILFSRWNYFCRGVDRLLEQYGYAIEWEDEWSTCQECGRAVRTQPDSYGWQPSYAIFNECELLCVDCLKVDAESYLESLEDNPRTALNLPCIDPAKFGYRMLQGEFESGFHPGQTDDPKKIYAELAKSGHKRILFRIDSVGQFDMRFSVWEKIEGVQS